MKIWVLIPFLFEVHNVPRGLIEYVKPFLQFSYVWILFDVQTPPRWNPVPFDVKDYPGFYAEDTERLQGFFLRMMVR